MSDVPNYGDGVVLMNDVGDNTGPSVQRDTILIDRFNLLPSSALEDETREIYGGLIDEQLATLRPILSDVNYKSTDVENNRMLSPAGRGDALSKLAKAAAAAVEKTAAGPRLRFIGDLKKAKAAVPTRIPTPREYAVATNTDKTVVELRMIEIRNFLRGVPKEDVPGYLTAAAAMEDLETLMAVKSAPKIFYFCPDVTIDKAAQIYLKEAYPAEYAAAEVILNAAFTFEANIKAAKSWISNRTLTPVNDVLPTQEQLDKAGYSGDFIKAFFADLMPGA